MRDRHVLSGALEDDLRGVIDSAMRAGFTVADPQVQQALLDLYASMQRDEWIKEGVRALEYIKDEMRRERRSCR